MNNYKIYLENKCLAQSTIAQYVQHVEGLLEYSLSSPQQLTYTDLLKYVHFLQGLGKSKPLIAHRLLGIRHYFAYLLATGARNDNPALHLQLKGVKNRRQVPDWLPFEELESVYEKYTLLYPTAERSQVLLSLLLYQGLTVSELRVLEVQHIDLKRGKVQVPSVGKSNGRTLSLDLRQMLLLVNFLQAKTGLLFVSQSVKTLPNLMNRLMGELRLLHPGIKNSVQIRNSVLTHWLKSEDLRVVQYKAGHRYVSSTERYQLAHLAALQQEVSKVHPLG